MQLDHSQLKFVKAPVANIRLLAPAGCGKTACLLQRCRYLAQQAHPSRSRFLIVTFTVAARQELQSRIEQDSDLQHFQDQIDVATLNSWGFRQVKREALYPKLISGTTDYHFAMLNQLQPIWKEHKALLNAMQGKNTWKRNNAPQKLMNVMDTLKSLAFDHVRHTNQEDFDHHWNDLIQQGLEPHLDSIYETLSHFDIVVQDAKSPPERRHQVYCNFFQFWRQATSHLISNDTFTLEDQKYVAWQNELKNTGKRLSGVAGYDHVFVDEFQDINPLDLSLIRSIAERRGSAITIVGDDDQAIFEWRGSSPQYILTPEEYFDADFQTYKLGVNYRSPKNIVHHSQLLIAHNRRRVQKAIKASQAQQADIRLETTVDLNAALELVADLVKSTGTNGRTAIIGRKRSQLIPYQVHFASEDIPFCAVEDLQLFLSKAFERLLDLMEIKARLQNRSRRGVIEDTLFLCDYVKRYPLSRKDRPALRNHLKKMRPKDLPTASHALMEYTGPLKGKNTNGSVSMAMATALIAFINAKDVSGLMKQLSIHFEGLHIDFGKAEEDIFYTDPPFFELAEYAKRHGDDFNSFVEDIELAKDTLASTPPFGDVDHETKLDNPLHLMTALRAKGKEFDTVVLLDVNEGIWPSQQAKTDLQLEAERRVFYVAFTRARKAVVMLAGSRDSGLSRYVSELGIYA